MKASGFSIVEGLIAVTLAVLVGLGGYNLYSMKQAQSTSASEQQEIANQVPAAPEVKKEADLDTAIKTLDSIDVDRHSNELESLDSETAF